ncbi:MAG: hypothetical protein ACOCRK_07030 [bacterium]
MLIKNNGKIKKDIKAILLKNDNYIPLDNNQFFQESKTGKTLELWQGNPFDENAETCHRICYWRTSSIIAYYH